MQHRLIVYARSPIPGHAKTRLAGALGAEAAAGVYARFLYAYLQDLLESRHPLLQIELAVADPASVPFFAAAYPELEVRPQVAGNLGQRLAASFGQSFAAGASAVVITGSDVPGLDFDRVDAAFRALEHTPAVIGPALDGGYYLIGQRAPGAPLFDGVDWGSSQVLAQTERLARACGLALFHLPPLLDVDTGADYTRWRETLGLAGEKDIEESASRFEHIYRAIRQVPAGRVVTYGQIARALGDPRGARTVGWALRVLPDGSDVPWQRVINSQGRISVDGGVGAGAQQQRRMLEEEGVTFAPDGRIDLERYGWDGPFYL